MKKASGALETPQDGASCRPEGQKRPASYSPKKMGALCHKCPLKGHKVVPPTPCDDPKMIIVGESPGRFEVAHGVPFIGPSGLLLNKILDEVGFDRSQAHVTNAILCQPDEDGQAKQAAICCAPRLARELAALDSKVPIVALGAVATRILLGAKSIFKIRGFVCRVPALKGATDAKAGGQHGRNDRC